MVSSKAATVERYLAELPADRRAEIEAVRRVILKHLPKGYTEIMQYGMIGYAVPLSLYPAGYHCKKGEPLPYAALAAQKNHCSVYLSAIYADESARSAFEKDYAASGKKLDAGKSCVRFRRAEDLALDVVGAAVARFTPEEWIALYEKSIRR